MDMWIYYIQLLLIIVLFTNCHCDKCPGTQCGEMCCPYPEGVCCTDGVCCPQGSQCSTFDLCILSDGNKTETLPLTSPSDKSLDNFLNAIPSLRVGLQRPSDAASPSLARGQHPCGDGSQCDGLSTCCRQANASYACCPMQNAVCCRDGEHCCPENFECNSDQKTCQRPDSSSPVAETSQQQQPAAVEERGGPERCSTDNSAMCPAGSTCCKLQTDDWGCCPINKAVCCKDKIHCCPHDTTCNLQNSTCDRAGRSIPFLKPMSAEYASGLLTDKKASNAAANMDSFIANLFLGKCPSGNTACLGGTCCTANGVEKCCKFPNAVCCPANQGCCRAGFKCVADERRCIPDPAAAESPSSAPSGSIDGHASLEQGARGGGMPNVCPGGAFTCESGKSCCELPGGIMACCPYTNGTCCSDKRHCCPNGFTCADSGCQRTQTTVAAAAPSPPPIRKQCGRWSQKPVYCRNNATCCPTKRGNWSCCPLPDAVCCANQNFCCPKYYTCSPARQQCVFRGLADSSSERRPKSTSAVYLVPLDSSPEQTHLDEVVPRSMFGAMMATSSFAVPAKQNMMNKLPFYRAQKVMRHTFCDLTRYCNLDQKCCPSDKHRFTCIAKEAACCSSEFDTYCANPSYKCIVSKGLCSLDDAAEEES